MKWVNAFVQSPEKSEDVKKYFIKYNGKMYVAEWKYNTFYVSWGGIPHSDDQFGPSYEDRRDQLSRCYWLDESDESPSSDPAEVLQLRQWKKEATALLAPILEYGLKHPEIKLGQSATSFVLNRAKAAEVLVRALETALYYHVLSPDLDALFRTALSQHEQLKQHP